MLVFLTKIALDFRFLWFKLNVLYLHNTHSLRNGKMYNVLYHINQQQKDKKLV